MNRSEKIGGPGQVLQRQFEEQILSGESCPDKASNLRVVRFAAGDRMLKDSGIRGQTCNRKLVDVFLQRAVVEYVAGDVVEPQTLTEIMKFLRRFHSFLLL